MKKSDPMPALRVTASRVPPGETFILDGVDCMRVSTPAGSKLASAWKVKPDRVFAISLSSGHLMNIRPNDTVELIEMIYLVNRPSES